MIAYAELSTFGSIVVLIMVFSCVATKNVSLNLIHNLTKKSNCAGKVETDDCYKGSDQSSCLSIKFFGRLQIWS